MGALRCTSSVRFCILRLSPTLLSTTLACSVTLQTTQRNSAPKAKAVVQLSSRLSQYELTGWQPAVLCQSHQTWC